MKILQIVTLVSPDGAYGGPTRVAFNQAEALSERGHEVHVAGAYRGYPAPPGRWSGIPLHLFPSRTAVPKIGFAGVTSPGLFAWLARNIRYFDVVQVHLARDLVTLPAAAIALYAQLPLVLQTHGMIDPSSKFMARPLDLLLTRRILRRARAVLYLTTVEASGLVEVVGNDLNLEHLRNGVPVATSRSDNIPQRQEVLYLARLQERKRPLVFAEAAQELLTHHPSVAFTLAGPDEGQGPAVQQLLQRTANPRLSWEGPIPPEGTLARMKQATVYVLPSVNEPYPMTVLESLSVGVPVVITDTCGLAEAIERSGAGIVIDDSVDSLVNAIDSLLTDRELRDQCATAARRLAETEFGMRGVAKRLEEIYKSATNIS